jgi:hypothetical protein
MSLRLALLSWALISCQSPPPVKETDGRAALGYVKAQLDIGPRIPGTATHRAAGDWIERELRARADSVIVQAWPHRTASGDTVQLRNFIGRFNPAASRRLLFLAHWDTKPLADYDTGARAKEPVPGANDGASGVAVLLAMADALKKKPPAIGVDLLFVDAEDFGTFTPEVDVLLGSKYYAANQPAGGPPEYAVLLDLVGGARAQFRREGNSVIGAPAVVDLVWETAARMGYGNLFLAESGGSTTDDHIPLQQAGIRAIDVIGEYGPGSSYPWWHTTEDTIDKLSPEVLKGVGDVMIGLIREAKQVR